MIDANRFIVFEVVCIFESTKARQRARELANTPEFAKAQRQGKKLEALFAEPKNQIGVRRLRLRPQAQVALLAAAVPACNAATATADPAYVTFTWGALFRLTNGVPELGRIVAPELADDFDC
jgi:hypothetical protein